MTDPAPPLDASLLLARAGATGLSAAEQALLAPALQMIDAKVALLRRAAAAEACEAGIDPTDPTRPAPR